MVMKNKQTFMLAVFFLCLFRKSHVCLGADTISANQSLSGDQTITSAGEIFEMGFHKPGNSSNYYICVWYKNIPVQNLVWVANREEPVSDRFTSELRISDGNLVLLNESQIPIWSTNVSSTTSSSVEAVLGDDGNLVLKDIGSNSPRVLWQSFDHPAHAWLPGVKIKYNKITKESQRIISWKNENDPAPGLFSLELEVETNSYVILWNRSQQYWSSGSWNGHIFELSPEMNLNYIYTYKYVTNENESYFVYFVKNNSPTTRSVMDVSGQIKQQNWMPANGWNLFWSQPRQQCEVYAICGAYGSCNQKSLPFCNCLRGFEPESQNDWDLADYSGGCKRKTKLQCGNSGSRVGQNGERDKFLQISSMSLPKKYERVGSAAECESTCLTNCSCTAYALENNGCLIWIEGLLDLKQLSEDRSMEKILYVRLAASELTNPKKHNRKVIGVVAGGAAGLAILLGFIVFVILRQRKKTIRPGKTVEGSLTAFNYRYLQNATKNFSEKLGGGGFGSVFKGTLPDSTVIAVKQLESASQGEKQFRTEIIL